MIFFKFSTLKEKDIGINFGIANANSNFSSQIFQITKMKQPIPIEKQKYYLKLIYYYNFRI